MDLCSIRLTFMRDEENRIYISEAIGSGALPYPSAPLKEYQNTTGIWLDLEDENKRRIYSLLLTEINFPTDILIPFFPNTKYVVLYMPPQSENDLKIRTLGQKSIATDRFEIPPIKSLNTLNAISLPADICNEGKGRVLRSYSVSYCGRKDHIYNMVLLADRFAEDEQSDFSFKANGCINFLFSHAPFNEAFGAGSVNVYFVEVDSSNGSYFSTTFKEGSTHVAWDENAVKMVCDELFSENGSPYWNWAGLIINYSKQTLGTGNVGGNPSQFAVGTVDESFWYKRHYYEVFQHEFGHSAFSLADEYSNEGAGNYTGLEPRYANVTKELDIEKIKWKNLLTPNISLPTKNDSRTDVGCYEGAYTYEYGIYRPQYNCVMREDSSADGCYCKICKYEATKVLARSVGLFIPAPGCLRYSDISLEWTNLTVASKVTKNEKRVSNYSGYSGVIQELQIGEVGEYVSKLFTEKEKVTLAEQTDVFMSYYDPEKRGLWYLIPDDKSNKMYYVYAFNSGDYNELALGEMKLPSYPVATMFDGAMVGNELHVFCCDNGQLSYGKQDSYGEIESNFTIQTVKGLKEPPDITALSTAYESSRIMVAVVEEKVKIAAYELLSGKWASEGFVELPSEDTEPIENIKISQSGNFVHAAVKTSNAVLYRVFDVARMLWDTENTTINTGTITHYDICTRANQTYVITYDGKSVLLYHYNKLDGNWENPENITVSLGMPDSSIVTSLGIALLHNCLHIVAIINRKPMHACYNVVSREWISPFLEISPLLKLSDTLDSIILYSDNNQLYLVISNKVEAVDGCQ